MRSSSGQPRGLVLLGDRHHQTEVRLDEGLLGLLARPGRRGGAHASWPGSGPWAPWRQSASALRPAFDGLGQADLVVLGQQRVLADVGQVEPDQILVVALDALLCQRLNPSSEPSGDPCRWSKPWGNACNSPVDISVTTASRPAPWAHVALRRPGTGRRQVPEPSDPPTSGVGEVSRRGVGPEWPRHEPGPGSRDHRLEALLVTGDDGDVVGPPQQAPGSAPRRPATPRSRRAAPAGGHRVTGASATGETPPEMERVARDQPGQDHPADTDQTRQRAPAGSRAVRPDGARAPVGVPVTVGHRAGQDAEQAVHLGARAAPSRRRRRPSRARGVDRRTARRARRAAG